MAKKIKKPSYLNYHWGEALHSQQHGTQVRFLRWLDVDETQAEVAELAGIRPIPGSVPASDLSRSPSTAEPIVHQYSSGQFNAACDEARDLLRKS